MIRRSGREASFTVTRLVLAFALTLACVAAAGCKKDDKGDGDAAADAAAVADAGAADAADAAVVDAADAATAPLATTVAPRPVVKPKPDPPICAAARSAKARNSPAAPGLEKQCIAAGGTL